MSRPERAWAIVEPEIGGVMDAFRVENIGHAPAKTETVRARFPFEGIVMVLRGSGFFRIDGGPIRQLQAL